MTAESIKTYLEPRVPDRIRINAVDLSTVPGRCEVQFTFRDYENRDLCRAHVENAPDEHSVLEAFNFAARDFDTMFPAKESA